jgi:iron complex outermembrane receptor protein
MHANPLTFLRCGRRLLCLGGIGFFTLAPAGTPGRAQGATGAVEGRVLNPVTGDYLNNARVSIPGTGRVAFTDLTGAYRLSGVPVGSVTVRAFFTDLEEHAVTVTVIAGGVTRQDFELTSRTRSAGEETPVRLGEYVVAAAREMEAAAIAVNEQRFAPNLKQVVAADAFGDVSEGNVGELVKYLPGVSIEYGAGDARAMLLRGLPSEFTPVTLDGNRMASAASSSASRVFEFEQVSLNNLARVEVTKSPVPSQWADALGGAVNLVSKTAFERSRPLFTVRGFLTFTDEELTLGRTPGPGSRLTPKVRPGADFSYLRPVTPDFGFTITGLYSDQFGRERFSIPTWEYLPASGGSEARPYFRGYALRDDPRETQRQSIAFNTDWRPVRPLTLSLGYQYNTYDLLTMVNRLTFNTGTLPAAYSPTATTGRANAATVTHTPLWVSKYGHTNHVSLGARWRRGDWRADFSGAWSEATNRYRDLSEGFFRTGTLRIATPTLDFTEVGRVRPGAINVRTAAGPADWRQVANYQIATVESLPATSSDELSSGRLDVRRDLVVGRQAAAVQVGGAWRRQLRDRVGERFLYTYVGPDGRSSSADDGAGAVADTVYAGRDPEFGWPATIQWPSMARLGGVFREHPEYFTLNLANNHLERASDSERIQETLTAAYVQGELKLCDGRLHLVGGWRGERTTGQGVGLKRDRDAIYQRDAAGNLIRGPNGQPVLITTDALAQAKLQYLERGSRSDLSYDGWYPSANASWAVRPNLLLRLGYSRTIGRPNFTNIIANVDIDEDQAASPGQPGGSITMRNPNLRPWTSDNLDLAVEYYFEPSGVLSLGAFRKDIKDSFGTFTYLLDDALLAQFGLERDYRGWELTTRFNAGAARITGAEAAYQQKLTFLPAWGRGLSAFASGTVLDLDGTRTDFSGFIEKSASWGLSYSRGRVGARMNWNWRGRQFINNQNFAPDAVAFTVPRLTLDTNLELRVNRRLAVFLNARNLTGNRSIGRSRARSRRTMPGCIKGMSTA